MSANELRRSSDSTPNSFTLRALLECSRSKLQHSAINSLCAAAAPAATSLSQPYVSSLWSMSRSVSASISKPQAEEVRRISRQHGRGPTAAQMARGVETAHASLNMRQQRCALPLLALHHGAAALQREPLHGYPVQAIAAALVGLFGCAAAQKVRADGRLRAARSVHSSGSAQVAQSTG